MVDTCFGVHSCYKVDVTMKVSGVLGAFQALGYTPLKISNLGSFIRLFLWSLLPSLMLQLVLNKTKTAACLCSLKLNVFNLQHN